nr:uncharacterized protein LOC109150426 [Ipomoea batatas]
MGKMEFQRSVFDRLGSNPKAPKRNSIHDRLGAVQVMKDNASHPVEVGPSKMLRSMIPSRIRRETNIHVSCGEVLKVQPRTIVHTRVHEGENEESVGSSDDIVPTHGDETSSFHITLCDETPIKGTLENPRPIFISTLISNEDEEIYVKLLKEYIDVFAWTYKEMTDLDPKVAVHRLAVKKACRPVKQAQRRFCPELIPSIEGEINKLIEAVFIREVKYPTWISSIVPVVFVKGFNERLLDLLLHRLPPFFKRPCPVAPCEVLTDLVMEEGPEESLRFLLVATKEPGQVGVARHLLIHLGGFALSRLHLLFRPSNPIFQGLHLLFQFLVFGGKAFLEGNDLLTHHILRRFGTTGEVVGHMRKLRKIGLEVPNGLAGRDDGSNLLEQACRVLAALSQGIQYRGRAAGRPQLRPAAGGTKVVKMNLRPGVLAMRSVEVVASFETASHRPERPATRPAEEGVSFAKHPGWSASTLEADHRSG